MMRTFIVETVETVAGKYLVRAESEDEAIQLLERDGGISHASEDQVEQLEYSAFSVEVREVADVHEAASLSSQQA